MLKIINKTLRFFLLLSGMIFFLTACDSRPENVMSQDEMVDFLTDLHKLDGALSVNYYNSAPDSRENVYYYNALFKKYGISKADFDSSLVWYVSNPKKFNNIYTQVVDNLTQFEVDVKNRKFHPIDSVALRHMKKDIWSNRTAYTLTKDSLRSRLAFKIQSRDLQWRDAYVLSFRQRIAPLDSGLNKNIVMRIFYADGKKDSIYAKAVNDSILRKYSLRLVARHQSRIDSITGHLSGSSKNKGKLSITVDSIKLMREYDELAQDSIRTVIKLIEHPLPVITEKDDTINRRIRNKVLLYKNETGK